RPRRPWRVWAGVLGAPAAWGLQLQVCYTVSATVLCAHGHVWLMHLFTALFLALSLAGGVLSWREWHEAGRAAAEGSEASREGRTRFLGLLGMMTSGLFSLLIVAQGI